MRVSILSFGLLATLAACGTPQEQCIRSETRDLRILDRLIGETETNIARGYALDEVHLTRDRWVLCRPRPLPGATDPKPSPEMCLDEVDYTELRPRAIDLSAEARKLKSMQQKRTLLARQAAPRIKACQAQYPE